MGARGQPPTPTAILEMRGSWRAKARAGEPKPPKGRPRRPKYFNRDQQAVWKRLCRVLDSVGVLTTADRPQLERYCVMYVRWRQCEDHLARHGQFYAVRSDDPSYYMTRLPNSATAIVGYEPFPHVAEAGRLDKALKAIEQQFGLTPAARVRLASGPGEDSPKAGLDSYRIA